MRVLIVLPLCLALTGCGIVARKERQEMLAKSAADFSSSAEACRQQYPDRVKQAVPRAACLNDATTRYYRPTVQYPDLADQIITNRMVWAEQTQQGRITVAVADQQMATLVSQVTAEEQRRNLANRSVGAQETAAAAAAAPVSCTRIGNTTNCY